MDERILEVREVSEKEFREIINNRINIKVCPVCGLIPQLILDMHFYRKSEIKLKCFECGFEKSVDLETEKLFTENQYGTPVTARSLALSIANVIHTWNKCSDENQIQKDFVHVIESRVVQQ